MKKQLQSILIISFLTACAQTTKVEAEATLYDDEALMKHIKTLSSDKFEGRKTGTEGNKKAQDYIVSQFKSLNVKPFDSKFKHNFEFARRDKTFDATNILGFVKGVEFSDKYIVVSAHYDHLGKQDGKIYNGADDDASGVAALFAFAEMLKKNPPKHSIVLAAFDAEELSLQGAKYFVDKIKDVNIVANINMDMISRSSKNELYVVELNLR
ncbi:MAG: M20/M25/M40 family metallo-hydrolase [Winogradskyella sp.]|uniref:M20/M25/M40 family metallo-hydrolase n=1 Tax=Winogradskyella sp. TaxID=1883156 RepID=UPI0018046215|nr:M20/M25/M40 family metallo-hydrolase [Winogradskyella sp.]MBT8244922.1 M20/M25/M40 family metallo-hydrolase [Winogradskyella sp.]NNK22469.1 M20/M25/M40 family metallo-hydrolase [Winogradskyella sp.]